MSLVQHVLWTGSQQCFDNDGNVIPCQKTGQDAALDIYPAWPEPRFEQIDTCLVQDRATQLIWLKKATISDFPLSWQESLESIRNLNKRKEFGRDDWRLPNRRELRSLVDHSRRNSVLPAGHPFDDVALGWYWSSTSSAMNLRYAWYVHFEGGRMFYGGKTEQHWAWPVCGDSEVIIRTGQSRCFDTDGKEVMNNKTGCDGDRQAGVPWPQTRFTTENGGVIDQLTGLLWYPTEELEPKSMNWEEALHWIKELSRRTGRPWRMPTINEMESLVDCSRHSPALPKNAPFSAVKEAYWTSTTSGYENDWAYVLYLHKGAVGVGFKKNRDFHIWPVMSRA